MTVGVCAYASFVSVFTVSEQFLCTEWPFGPIPAANDTVSPLLCFEHRLVPSQFLAFGLEKQAFIAIANRLSSHSLQGKQNPARQHCSAAPAFPDHHINLPPRSCNRLSSSPTHIPPPRRPSPRFLLLIRPLPGDAPTSPSLPRAEVSTIASSLSPPLSHHAVQIGPVNCIGDSTRFEREP